ncbi:amidase [Mycolicibacterium smegmatis]|uniref:amidase n=1 Tax=Mycolicibacterium smegmatis TaxID=1772 RepID=UPI0013032EDE|nr:amidase family protein [Mycolicibacterium smegmatis]
MKLDEYAGFDAIGLAELVAVGQISATELAEVAIEAVGAVNSQINAVIETWDLEPTAFATAEEAGGPLAGVPFLVKDLGVTVAGRRNELGSRLTQGNTAASNSVLVERLIAAGLVPLGRTTTPEFAWSTLTESVLAGVTRNPWDLSRSPGGSSGGSAAIVAAGAVPMAHATDAAGSIRIPAASCGLFGLKPGRGRVSNGPALDQAVSGLAAQLGVSRSVRDSAALLDALCGPDAGAPVTIADANGQFLAATHQDPGRLRIALMLDGWGGSPTTSEVRQATSAVAALCENLAHHVELAAPELGVGWPEFVRESSVLWSANIATWIEDAATATGRPIDATTLEPQTLAVHRTGSALLAVDVIRAVDARNAVTRNIAPFFETYDVLLTPTLPDVAVPVGQYTASTDDLDGYLWTERLFTGSPFTAFANSAGLPAMTVPLSTDPVTGLPIGAQFVTRQGGEGLLLQLAAQLERAAPWADRHPPVWVGATA